MNDLISRQAAIEEVREATIIVEYKETDRLESVAASVIKQTKKGIEYLLEDLPTAQQWIPCSERLPEPNHIVLVFEEGNKNIWTACISDWSGKWELPVLYGKWQRFEYSDYNSIVAWMPLPDDPEPYKGVE